MYVHVSACICRYSEGMIINVHVSACIYRYTQLYAGIYRYLKVLQVYAGMSVYPGIACICTYCRYK